ncbi:AAA family ATPase [Aeromonas caviae]|uniref:AAA family ATPase n=1 Tax=Aeromonas caviae TaxID=648 RepID=UPI0029D66536|nr:AAA family ATPase [Aeromonas caviae]MDX7703313.1 AAA family ATPase [Aeromonas caviae]MDX7793919.1 AAA family ATPase [Aeromonas caviae]
MNLLELKDKIKSHLVAGYPGLYIHSGEEARVDAMLQDIASQLHLHPKEWNLGYGWVDFVNKQPLGSQGPRIDLAESLPSLLDEDLDHKLFIIKDARSALENQPLAVARLKQLLNRIQRHHRGKAAVVLVSETLHIPSQIEAQMTLLPLPLPRGEEISIQLDAVCLQLDLLVPDGFRHRLHAACSGLNQEEIRSALAMVRQHHEQISDVALQLIQHEKEQIISKSGVLEMLRVSENATDIGGLENLKTWLSRRAQIFRRLSEARAARVLAPKGVLIAGMPGCGKSLTAKAAASLFQLPLLRLDIGSLLGKYVGESEHNMRRALNMAESVSPCILWIDELEKAFVGMNSGSGSEVSSRLFGYFLTWMQEKTGAVFVIATANNITALPPELLRKGRFDEVFYVGFPNAAERGAILDIHLKGETLELEPRQRRKLVTQCRDYAGADIQNAINEARETAFLDGRPLELEDLEVAIKLTVPLRETLREQVAKYEELFEKLKLKPASACDGLNVAQMIQMAESHNALRRKEVARHEDCPDDLLEKLVDDTDSKVRTAAYGNPNCPEKLLTLRINIEEGQPDFDLALLHLACLHANAPHDLIAAQFERLKLNTEQRHQLAKRSDDESLQQRLLADQEPLVRSALAANKAVGKAVQQQLARDPEGSVRSCLIGNDNLHLEVQEQLARDPSYEVRERLAWRDELSETAQLLLTCDEDQDVLDALARRAGAATLPDSVQLELVKCDPDVREALAQNENLGAPAQFLLAQDLNTEVRRILAEHPNLTSAALQYLTMDVEEVQASLAGNHHLDSALLQMGLSQHESESVRSALAGNRALNIDVQARLLKDVNPKVRKALSGNSNLAESILEVLMRDENDDVRECLVRWRDSVLPSVQRHLATDPNIEIRKYLARAADLLDDVQQQLASDLPEVQQELASNAALSAEIQQRLLERGDIQVLSALARNQGVTAQLQARLADDRHVEVRTRLAHNPALAGPVADKLIGDVEAVQKALAGNRHLSEAQYLHLYKGGNTEVRETLAENSRIGEDLMTLICQDGVSERSDSPTRRGANSIHSGYMGAQNQAMGKQGQSLRKEKLVLAARGNLPGHLQSALLTEGEQEEALLEALAGNSTLIKPVQQALAGKKSAKVRAKLAANEDVDADILHQLLSDPVAEVRAALVRDWWMDNAMELELARDKDVRVRCAVAAKDRPSKTVQLLLASDSDKSVRTCLLKRDNHFVFTLHSQAQETLARDSDPFIRELLAAYPKLKASVQLVLAKDDKIGVRKALAKGHEEWFGGNLCEEAQLRLSLDQESSVRLALAENHSISPSAQEMLAQDALASVRLKLVEASSYLRQLTTETQRILSKDPDSKVRQELACKLFGFLAIPSGEDVQLTLASDPDPGVKLAILGSLRYSGNMRMSDAVRERLLEELDDDTRQTVEEMLDSCEES